MPKPTTTATPTATNPWHPPHEFPDSDITVLLRLGDLDDPIWPGFHDGQDWRAADGARLGSQPTGWMHLDVAARLLDSATQ